MKIHSHSYRALDLLSLLCHNPIHLHGTKNLEHKQWLLGTPFHPSSPSTSSSSTSPSCPFSSSGSPPLSRKTPPPQAPPSPRASLGSCHWPPALRSCRARPGRRPSSAVTTSARSTPCSHTASASCSTTHPSFLCLLMARWFLNFPSSAASRLMSTLVQVQWNNQGTKKIWYSTLQNLTSSQKIPASDEPFLYDQLIKPP